jgi:hypothetical protein
MGVLVIRWGFASIVQTAAELQGDATLGSALPAFGGPPANGTLSWQGLSADDSAQGWDGFALLVNDVLRYTGSAASVALTSVLGDDAASTEEASTYFRLALQRRGVSGDFTRAAVWHVLNGTWTEPAPGAT